MLRPRLVDILYAVHCISLIVPLRFTVSLYLTSEIGNLQKVQVYFTMQILRHALIP